MNKYILTTLSAVILLTGCTVDRDYGYSVKFVYENLSGSDIVVKQIIPHIANDVPVRDGDTVEIMHLAPGGKAEFHHEAMGIWPVWPDENNVLPYDYNHNGPHDDLRKALIIYNGTDTVIHETTDWFEHFTPEQHNICDRSAYTLTEPDKHSRIFTFSFNTEP